MPQSGKMVGRHIYLRDNDTEKIWNIGWYPTNTPLDEFSTTHRPFQTVVRSIFNEIEATVTFTVSAEDTAERWQVEINSKSKKKRRLSLFIYCHWENYPGTTVVFRGNEVIAKQPLGDNRVLQSFLTLDHPADSFDCEAESFIGTYKTIANPQAVVDGKCSRSSFVENPVGVLQKNLTLGPSGSSTLGIVLGTIIQDGPGSQPATASINRIVRDSKNEFGTVGRLALERVIVKSPDEDLNRFLNCFIPYQSLIEPLPLAKPAPTIAEIGETLANGSIYRPDALREKLLELLQWQNKSGETVTSIRSNNPDYSLSGTIATCRALTNYLNETGDVEIFKERIRFFDSGKASVLEHLVRATQTIQRNLWSKPESFSFSHRSLMLQTLQEVLPALSAGGEDHLVRKYQQLLDGVPKSIAGFTLDRGKVAPTGSNRELLTENQCWAILLGAKRPQKDLVSILNTVVNKLSSPYGIQESLGGHITSEALANFINAAVSLNQPEIALQGLTRQWPFSQNKTLDRYKGEPYLFPELIFPTGTIKAGQASEQLNPTAAGRISRIITENIAGIRPTIGGLKIDPIMPRSWRQVDVSREFRGATYNIRIHNPLRLTRGVDRLSVNGLKVPGNLIKPFRGGHHFVEVILG